jgi:hypothetical protein
MNFKKRKILKILNDNPGKRYSELYKNFSEEDKFPYHLKYLVKNQLIVKKDDKYFVTHAGSSIAVNWIDTKFNELIHKVPRIVFICNFKNKFLIKKYYSNVFEENQFYGLPGIKVPFGQKEINSLITSELQSKYKVEGEHKFKGIQNLLIENKEGKVIFDFIYLIFNVDVKLTSGDVEGFSWFTRKEVQKLPPVSSVLEDYILKDSYETFSEKVFVV